MRSDNSAFYAWAIVCVWFLCAGMGFAQGPQAPMPPAQALKNLDEASGAFSGTRAQHITIQDSLNSLAAVLRSYEQYTTGLLPKKAAPQKKKQGK